MCLPRADGARPWGSEAFDVAPAFAQLAPYVLRAVTGRTIVAHKASFDLRFLAAQFLRAGVPLTLVPLPGLCTMKCSPSFIIAPSRKLQECCTAAGVLLHDAHWAPGDALATAGLLRRYLEICQWRPPWIPLLEQTRAYPWPVFYGTLPNISLRDRTQPGLRPPARGWTESPPGGRGRSCRGPELPKREGGSCACLRDSDHYGSRVRTTPGRTGSQKNP